MANTNRNLTTMTNTETPIFRKDWPQAVAAGFEEINTSSGYRTPTDDFLKGMAKDFQQQQRDWEYEMEQIGALESVYDDAGVGRWVYVTPDEAAKIRESNSKRHKQETTATAAAENRAKAKRDNKWYRKLLRVGRK